MDSLGGGERREHSISREWQTIPQREFIRSLRLRQPFGLAITLRSPRFSAQKTGSENPKPNAYSLKKKSLSADLVSMRFLAGITAFPTGQWVIPAYGLWAAGILVLIASLLRLAKPFARTKRLSLTPRSIGMLGTRAGLVAIAGIGARAFASEWVTIGLDGERTVLTGFSPTPLARLFASLCLVCVATASATAADRPLLRLTSARAVRILTSTPTRLAIVALAIVDFVFTQPPSAVLVLSALVALLLVAASRRAIVDRNRAPLMIGAASSCGAVPEDSATEIADSLPTDPFSESETAALEAEVLAEAAEQSARTEVPDPAAAGDPEADPSPVENVSQSLALRTPQSKPKQPLLLPTNADGRRTELYATGVAVLASLALFVGFPGSGSSLQTAPQMTVTQQSATAPQPAAVGAELSSDQTAGAPPKSSASSESNEPGSTQTTPSPAESTELVAIPPSSTPDELALSDKAQPAGQNSAEPASGDGSETGSKTNATKSVGAVPATSPTPTTSLLTVPASLKDKMPDIDGPALDNAEITKMCEAVGPAHRVCFRRAMIAVLRNKGMDESLKQFKELLRTNKAAEDDCHITVHELGREALALADGNLGKVTNLEDPICSNGLIHGAIIAKLDLVPRDKLAEEVPKLCELDPVDGPSGAEFASCVHGLGHALLLMTEDFYGSLKMCETFGELQKINRADQPDLRSQCGQGVYMQNNLMFREGLPGVTKVSDPMFPCNVAKEFMKDGCYAELAAHYYITRNIFDPKQVGPEVCEKVPEDFTYACYQGLVTVIATNNWDNPQVTAEFCNSIPPDIGKISCAESGASRYATIRIERDVVDAFCAAQNEPNKSACTKTRDERLAQADSLQKKSEAKAAARAASDGTAKKPSPTPPISS